MYINMKNDNKEFDFKVIKIFHEEEINKTTLFRICILNWGKKKEYLDIRKWWKKEDEKDWKPGKGISLTMENMQILFNLAPKISDYIQK